MRPLLLALALCACEPVRQAALDHVGGVQARTQCLPQSQACIPVPNTDGGVTPAACDHAGRYWPNLARDIRGNQRVCVGACNVNDAGIAGCL